MGETSFLRSAARVGAWASVIVLAVTVASCATRTVSLVRAPRSFAPSDYEDVYSRWTRTSDSFAFGRLQDVLNVSATFESWEFRWAYVVRHGEDHATPTAMRADLLRTTLDDAAQRHRFFVTLAGTDFRESDLTSDESAWRVVLLDDRGVASAPAAIERIRRVGAAERVYFRHSARQRLAFRIAFPATQPDGTPTIAPSARFVILLFTGALGTVDLRWDLNQGP